MTKDEAIEVAQAKANKSGKAWYAIKFGEYATDWTETATPVEYTDLVQRLPIEDAYNVNGEDAENVVKFPGMNFETALVKSAELLALIKRKNAETEAATAAFVEALAKSAIPQGQQIAIAMALMIELRSVHK
jgi:hypothetical protein